MTNHPPPVPADTMRQTTRPRWLLAVIAGSIGVLTLFLGIGAGAAVGTDVETAPEYQDLEAELHAAQGQEASLENELSESAAQLQALEQEKAELEANIPEREAAVAQREQKLDRRDQKLRRRERDVSKREKAISKVENRMAANTFGDGVYEVGVDIAAGTYRKDGGTNGCYYAILTSSDTSDIASNNLTDGPAVMSVAKGEYVETTRCGDWVLQQ